MRRFKRVGWPLFATAAVAAFAVAAPASAQQQGNPFSTGGPQAIPGGRETVIDPSVSMEYDSNIAASDEFLAAQRGLKLGDFIVTPGIDFTVARQIGRPLVYLRGATSYAAYTVNGVRDRANYNVDGGGSGHFGPCQESLTGSYSHTQSNLEEISALVVNNANDTENVAFAANCGRATGLTPTVSVQETWLTNSAAIERFVNNRSLAVEAGLGYARPTLGVISLFGSYSTATYPERRFLVPGPGGLPTILTYGYDLYAGGVRFVRPVGARISASLELSYSSLSPNLPGSAGFNGVTYSGDVTYALSSRLRTHVEAIRATRPSTLPRSAYAIATTYEADVSYDLGSRYTVMLSGQRLGSNYPGANQLPNGVPPGAFIDLTSQTTYSGLLTVNYRMSRRITLSLNGGEEDRQANAPHLSFTATTFTLQAHASF